MFVVEHVMAERLPVGHAPVGVNIASKEIIIGGTEMAEVRVISAHRTPDLLFEYASSAVARGLEVIIAAAGGAAHLAGMTAAKTELPVLGVPMESKALLGLDSLLSMVQMPGGVPVATFAIGKPGAINAALFATAMLGNKHPEFRAAYVNFRKQQTERGLANQKIK